MNIFDHWREQELRSTMERLQAERDELRLRLRLRDWIYWPALLGVVCVAIYKLWGAT